MENVEDEDWKQGGYLSNLADLKFLIESDLFSLKLFTKYALGLWQMLSKNNAYWKIKSLTS